MVTWCTGTLLGYMGQGPRKLLPAQKLVTHPSTQIHSSPTPHRCQIMPGPHQTTPDPHQIYARSVPDHTRSVPGPCQPVPGPHQIYTRSVPGPHEAQGTCPRGPTLLSAWHSCGAEPAAPTSYLRWGGEHLLGMVWWFTRAGTPG